MSYRPRAFRKYMAFICILTVRGFLSSFQNRSVCHPNAKKCNSFDDPKSQHGLMFLEVLLSECGISEGCFTIILTVSLNKSNQITGLYEVNLPILRWSIRAV